MRVCLHIILALGLASPVVALTPPPPCAGEVIEGRYAIWDSQAVAEGFVVYYAQQKGSTDMRVVLEHCASGKAIVVSTFWNDGSDKPGNVDQVSEALDRYVESDRNYTLRGIARRLNRSGMDAVNKRYAVQSCVCGVFFDDARSGASRQEG